MNSVDRTDVAQPVREAEQATTAAAAAISAAESAANAGVAERPARRTERARPGLHGALALRRVLGRAPVRGAGAVAGTRDGGPVLFRQTRVGRDGTPFTMLKYRSMCVDAEARLAGLTDRNDGAGPLFKMCADPRITRVGCVLRRFSLDELPQLFNVVGGSMALVGPRPALPREVARYCPLARRRLAVKPGLTGLWQVSGRSDLPWEESIRLDAEYVERRSTALDVRILFRTVGAVLGGGGAY